MATYFFGYDLVYINSNGDIVSAFKAEQDAAVFINCGDYLIPYDWSI